ncbi:class I SAM-dependent methyltransferase [Virgibacillus pantothenticus]|uniref:class I SAM-dependent methyltransferase n=1 Tax=Virgibacillus pantothenticus TaxID=1473 RepID=UPI0009865D18|nr:class I SAM-dependent methyltransferase [Virgibacillus pantothenticus]
MTLPRLYSDLAKLWPFVTSVDDYKEQSKYWISLIDKNINKERPKILDLGVGGGKHQSHYSHLYDITAIDLSEEMLFHSRKLNPTTKHLLGDMRTIRLEERFDVVLMHDAISYMTNKKDLYKAIHTAYIHLKDGGILIISPDFYKETFKDNSIFHSTQSINGSKVTFVEYIHDVNPDDTIVETIMMFLIHNKENKVVIEEDRHELGLFKKSTWFELLFQVGFEIEEVPYVKNGDGEQLPLLLGKKHLPK